MKAFSIILLVLLESTICFAQTRTLTTDGNWSAPGSWTGGIIATTVAEDVVMNNNVDVTITGVDNYTAGNLTAGNNNTLTINSGGSLTLGASGNLKTLNSGNGLTITVAGTLIIYGDVTIPNNLIWAVTGLGSVTITGNVTLSNNASITVNGNLNIGGNLSGGSNTTLTVNGTLDVGGNFTFANNTNVTVNGPGGIDVGGSTTVGGGGGTALNLNGGGTFHSSGPCSGPAGFCGTLPLTLVSFSAHEEVGKIILKWSTQSELNVDYFTLQRSVEGKDFVDIGTVRSIGVNFKSGDYTFTDNRPILGKSYYRLKEVDIDKTSTFFNIVAVDFSSVKSVVFYPNPVSNGLLLWTANFVTPTAYQVTVYDLAGRVIKQIIESQPESMVALDVSPGLYLVRFDSYDYHTITKVLVK